MAKAPKKKAGSGKVDNDIPQPIDSDGKYSVLVELRHGPGESPTFAMGTARGISLPGFNLDEEFEPVSLESTAGGMGGMDAPSVETYIVRGTVKDEQEVEALRAMPEVAEVWPDTPIAPFPDWESDLQPEDSPAAAPCPIPPCDCSPLTPKGNMADVANYLGVDQIWAAGFRGTGIVVGVLDSGITAQGRPVKAGETSRRIPRVIGGWPSDWGTESAKWGDHGNMCATDVLGMAPDAQLYDMRIAGSGGSPGTISRALQAFNWAINRHRTHGTPHVLTNSWGIYKESWDRTYARNPNHPFTRKVVEAINEGILVLFAAGNCGATCASGKCGTDVGPGKSIWGANGHPQVMTVGAVNKNEQLIGYSSQGPAALDPNKPDFCSISHFTGYNNSDNGTSAATPILAGVVALLKQAKASLNQSQCKSVLKATAKDIGPTGFDQHSGAGIVQALAAYRRLVRPTIRTLTPVCRPTTHPVTCRVTRVPVTCRPTRVPSSCRPTTHPVTCRPTNPVTCRPTRVPATCRPTTHPVTCRPTNPVTCRPTRVPATCRPTREPSCIRPTLTGPRCPRPTLRCPRPTITGCPRPTLTSCPRPTLVGCPRPTLARCPRPTLAGCPRPTFSAAMCTPPPPMAFEYDVPEYWDDEGYYDYYGEDEWYGMYAADEAEYWEGEVDQEAYDEEEWYDDEAYDEWDVDDEEEW